MTEKPQIEGRTVRILVVDDEEIVLSLVRDALEDAGYEIELASSGEIALTKAGRSFFDFILTDIRMPGCDGIELARQIREIIPSIGVLFMTGYANLGTAKDAIKEGAYDYIMKPFELSEMRQAVKNAIGKKQKDTEKTLAGELSRLSDLNQLMYTVGDRQSLMRLSLGFALMQGKTQWGAIAFRSSRPNEIGLVSTTATGDSQFQEGARVYERDYFNFESEQLAAPLIIRNIREHPLFEHFSTDEVQEFLMPPWYREGYRLLNVALKRGRQLYGMLILGYPEEAELLQASHLQLVTITANQIAISLENIILLEETRTAYSRLKDLQEQTIALEKMAVKGQMSAEIGHELNNFLGVVSGNISLLEHSLKKRDYGELDRYLAAVKSNLDNMRKFTQGLMDISSLAVHPERCDIGELIRDVVTYMETQKDFRNILIETALPKEPVMTLADPGQMRQLLYNLVKNAAEATLQKGAPPPHVVTVSIRPESAKNEYIVMVTDRGMGIEAELLEKAFQKSFTTKKDGHGFGLLVCHRIIDNHHGKLQIDSEPGRGTSIAIHFPLHQSQPEYSPTT